MTLEEVHSNFEVAPEYKVTKVDGATAQLLGGHGGVLLGQNFLVGAGLYTMVSGSHHQGLTYGGGLVAWEPWATRGLGLSVRGLIGAGQGTATQTVTLLTRDRRELTSSRLFDSRCFVAEPQADVLLRLTRRLKLQVGGGYRFVGDSHAADQFKGATGSVALRIGSAE